MTELVQLTFRLTVLFVFAAAVFGKLRSRTAWRAFETGLGSTGLFGWRTSTVTPKLLVAVESVIVIAVALPAIHLIGLALAVITLSVFNVAIAVLRRRGVTGSCSCFGSSGTQLGASHLVRNGLLAAIAITAMLMPVAKLPSAAGVGLTTGTAIFLTIIIVSLTEITDLFTPAAARRQ